MVIGSVPKKPTPTTIPGAFGKREESGRAIEPFGAKSFGLGKQTRATLPRDVQADPPVEALDQSQTTVRFQMADGLAAPQTGQ